MPAYTHLQRAEPVLVAHWLQAYVEMLLRDMIAAGGFDAAGLNYCPLGSGAVAGATLEARPHDCRTGAWLFRAHCEQHGRHQRPRLCA